MTTDDRLRPIPIGNAMTVEATGNDPISAARLALVELSEKVHASSMTSVSVAVTMVEPGEDLPWEATAFAALAE